MLAVHCIAWIWCGICTATCLLFIYWKRNSHLRDVAENNTEFRSLQRRFLFPYLIVLFSESLQAPYLYAFYHDCRYVRSQIAALYVVGLVSNIIFGFYYVHLSARYGRRSLCLLCIVAGCLGCSCKAYPSFPILLVGRIFDGIFAALVTSPFQQWYTDEHHVTFDFPPEWTHSTLLILSLGAGFLSVLAGITSHLIVGISKVISILYLLSIVTLLIGGVFITRQWSENRPADAPLPFRSVISKALGMIRSNPIAFVVSATTCCAEIASQMFVFVWAPLFMRIEHNGGKSIYTLGIIYASFVSSYLSGLLLFFSFTDKVRSSRLLSLSMASAFLVFIVAIRELPLLHNDWRATRFERVFLCMVIFEIACGVYSPAMEALQATVLQLPPQRSALVALIRLPLTFFLSLSILIFFPTIDGEFKLMTIIVILLFIATLLSLLLDNVVMNRGYEQDPDRFILPKTLLTDVKQTEQTTCTSS